MPPSWMPGAVAPPPNPLCTPLKIRYILRIWSSNVSSEAPRYFRKFQCSFGNSNVSSEVPTHVYLKKCIFRRYNVFKKFQCIFRNSNVSSEVSLYLRKFQFSTESSDPITLHSMSTEH